MLMPVVELGVGGTGCVLDDDAVEAEDEPVRDGTRLSTEDEYRDRIGDEMEARSGVEVDVGC